ncbi:hypothetical protein [Croceivirga sp. JEA036]|uniref:hypothetical protein n=1 Tax=Croceivirga sp. JEA036 TaxID=2721162 RepID=UPI001438CB93|nr:hypothetical protein [Croceivirga sp. JEA036]NJB35018.1 hypothetical protein [Croceivirga sp. JEA036]
MKKDTIEELFNRLDGQLDIAEPTAGHELRFLDKLNTGKGVATLPKKERNFWKPLSIAASIALVCVLGFQYLNTPSSIEEQVVKIAPEAQQTAFYFTSLIDEQVVELQEAKSPETAKLVDDTLLQLQKLEKDYKALEQELINGGNSKFILNAMIINFETRIALVKEVLENIEQIKNINTVNDANFTI